MQKFHSVFIAVTAILGSSQLCAAQAENNTEKERIVITGSHIKRISLEESIPLSVLTSDDIARSGATNLGDLMQMTEFGNGDFINNRDTNGFAAGATGFNMRGLRSDRTLVLIDGKRLPSYPFGQDGSIAFIDLNSIPLAEISRVEILKNGASAVYGSDAIGGVVNVITKREYQNSQFSVKAGKALKGNYNNTSVTYSDGFSTEQSEFIFIAELQKTNAMLGKDLDLSADLEPDELTGFSFPGTIFTVNAAQTGYDLTPAAGCAADNIRDVSASTYRQQLPNLAIEGNFCANDWTKSRQLIPDNKRALINTKFSQYFGDNTLYTNFNINQTNTDSDEVFGLVGGLFTIQSNSPFHPVTDGTGAPFRLQRGFTEFGFQNRNTNTRNYRFNLGINGIVDEYDFDISINHNLTKIREKFDEGWMTYEQRDALLAAVNAQQINPLERLSQENIDNYSTEFDRNGTSKLTSFNANISGELTTIGSGAVYFAAGAEFRKELIDDVIAEEVVNREIVGLGSVSASGDRTVNALFGELVVPVAENFEMNLSLRRDDYSDFGTSFNPQFSASYQPVDNFLVRGSWGKGFSAPNLFELYSSEVLGFSSYNDVVYPTRSNGNLELDAETSKNLSVGFAVDFTEDFFVTLDYWSIEIDEVISQLNVETILTLTDDNGDLVYADLITRNAQGEIILIDTPFKNINSLQTKGFDLSARWNITDTLELRLGASRLMELYQADSDTDTSIDLAGEEFFPQSRFNTAIIWNNDKLRHSLSSYYVGSRSVNEFTDIGADHRVNYRLDYRYDNHNLAFMINNLLDTAPPSNRRKQAADAEETGTWPYYERRIHSPLGRNISIQWTYNF